MEAKQMQTDPVDIPEGGSIRRIDPLNPFVAMSNRKRWGACALSAVLPQLRTPSGPSAEEGTEAHKVFEHFLGLTFGNPDGTPYTGWMPDVEPPQGLEDFDYSERGVAVWHNQVRGHAATYAEKAAGLFAGGPQPQCFVECKIEDVTIRGVRVFTIADALLWEPQTKHLVSGDAKYGRTPVGVGTVDEPNPQCAGGAVLWAAQHGVVPERTDLFVFQPRIRFGEAWQPLTGMGVEWLRTEWHKLDQELAAVAHAASEMAAGRLVEPCPGDHCSYCPSARWCPAMANYGKTAMDVESGKVAVVDLTPEQVMALWGQRPAFKAFEDDLRERVRMLYEAKHPAVQVKSRAGNRIWANPAGAVEALMLADRWDLLQPPALGKVEGILSAEDLFALTTRAPEVLTFTASDGKNPHLAAEAFGQYLTKGESK